MISRRDFIAQGAMGAAALYAGKTFAGSHPELYTLSRELTLNWGKTLLGLQIKDKNDPNYGTLIYRPENAIHGRMGDAIYPFLYLAGTTKNSDYVDASVLLYRWMEKHVSQPDGSWLNDPVPGAWKGITVFTSIALAEAVMRHGHLLDTKFKQEITARLKKSGDYIYNNFSISYGNINYPVAASYALTLLGELLDEPRFKQRGREFAHKVLTYVTPKDKFLGGEGGPLDKPSAKGCFSVDLGYNVEESLPSLVQYGLLTKDEEVLGVVNRMMETHMEFMLPDGGWDNSWGTRNYKWTYWGSRTSDGCQPAFALMADRNPVFYQVALRNTQLLKACTKDGLLQGGLHYGSHGQVISLHHTFCHIKALVTILDHGIHAPKQQAVLPRTKAYGSRFYSDIQTVLVAKGGFRATVTAYDRPYKEFRAGHASGGALSMLWHDKAGIILSASMNEYQLFESHNQHVDADPLSMPLTPRIELKEGGKTYTNINDYSATLEVIGDVEVRTTSRLVDRDLQNPSSGEVRCDITYRFTADKVSIHFKHDGGKDVKVIVPIISPSTEKIKVGEAVEVFRKDAVLRLTADKPLIQMPVSGKRLFNFVPGLEAMPFAVTDNDVNIVLTVK